MANREPQSTRKMNPFVDIYIFILFVTGSEAGPAAYEDGNRWWWQQEQVGRGNEVVGRGQAGIHVCQSEQNTKWGENSVSHFPLAKWDP